MVDRCWVDFCQKFSPIIKPIRKTKLLRIRNYFIIVVHNLIKMSFFCYRYVPFAGFLFRINFSNILLRKWVCRICFLFEEIFSFIIMKWFRSNRLIQYSTHILESEEFCMEYSSSNSPFVDTRGFRLVFDSFQIPSCIVE